MRTGTGKCLTDYESASLVIAETGGGVKSDRICVDVLNGIENASD
ncbi:hypothetical protein LV75_000640 [Actinokineospora diospyrosa]|uniref:Uncharacterized protein n=1 Tax=Actinokineospora diospyrosa TaxID=103728 RepID=A0ABT1I692_9PSEU|nr:hypothetical protein [Actinokineospora diospyrosa]